MFDRIANFLTTVWEHLLPFFIVNQFERALVLRFGKFNRELDPGFHWKIPLIEDVWDDIIVPRTINLSPQTLTTKDEKNLVVSTVITVQIVDVKKSILEIEGLDDAMEDICYGVIGDVLTEYTWKELMETDVREECAEEMNNLGNKYGFNIINVQFPDFASIRSYRLIT